VAKEDLEARLADLRKLAAAARKNLNEIAAGLSHLRGEINEVAGALGNPPPPTDADEAEREFEEIQATGARIPRHNA
jgi:hypothetical protein